MKPWTAWLAPLGVAGSCLLWVGCGSSGVPDPESDVNAAPSSSGGAPAAGPEPIAAAAAPAPAPDGATSAPAPAVASAAPAPGAAAAEPEAKTEETPAEGKSEAPSATTEMLALAGGGGDKGASAGSSETSAPGSGSASSSAPGGSGGSGSGIPTTPSSSALAQSGYPGAGGSGGTPGPGGTPSPAGYGPQTGGSGGTNAADAAQAAMRAQMAGTAGTGGGSSGPQNSSGDMAGMMSSGGGGGNNAAPSFTNPLAAVNSFLNAVRKKDPEALADATALHAGQETETSVNYRKVFLHVLERSLAPEDLDEIAKKFEGMKVMEMLPAKSTGRVGVVVGKSGKTQGEYFTRTITVRKEKAGWKVVDVSGQREFDAPIMIRGMPGMRGRRR
jgi:hypothetical protein